MTPEQQKELQDFRATLSDDQQAYFDHVTETQGEERVYARLGHMKRQIEYINSL
jgi:hypothetical protein